MSYLELEKKLYKLKKGLPFPVVYGVDVESVIA